MFVKHNLRLCLKSFWVLRQRKKERRKQHKYYPRKSVGSIFCEQLFGGCNFWILKNIIPAKIYFMCYSITPYFVLKLKKTKESFPFSLHPSVVMLDKVILQIETNPNFRGLKGQKFISIPCYILSASQRQLWSLSSSLKDPVTNHHLVHHWLQEDNRGGVIHSASLIHVEMAHGFVVCLFVLITFHWSEQASSIGTSVFKNKEIQSVHTPTNICWTAKVSVISLLTPLPQKK